MHACTIYVSPCEPMDTHVDVMYRLSQRCLVSSNHTHQIKMMPLQQAACCSLRHKPALLQPINPLHDDFAHGAVVRGALPPELALAGVQMVLSSTQLLKKTSVCAASPQRRQRCVHVPIHHVHGRGIAPGLAPTADAAICMQ